MSSSSARIASALRVREMVIDTELSKQQLPGIVVEAGVTPRAPHIVPNPASCRGMTYSEHVVAVTRPV